MSADEIELKAVVPDPDAVRARLAAAGARLVFAGRLVDRRYDLPDGRLARRDEVLRLRAARPDPAAAAGEAHASLDWKGPTRREGGYKVREERSSSIGDLEVVAHALERAGFAVVREVERDVEQWTLDAGPAAMGASGEFGAHAHVTLRLERYPRMDVLMEVEGSRAAIEHAIAVTGIARAAFGPQRLAEFAADFERRTGLRAALSARELGDDPPRPADA